MSIIKKQLFEQLAFVAHSLSSPQRVEVLDYLAQAERSVDELSQLTGLTVANTSRHLQILKQNGLVSMRKQGKHRLYQLAGNDVIALMASLRDTAEIHLAEVGRLMEHMPQGNQPMETISVQALQDNLDNPDWLVLDVRPTKEYHQGHLLGAVNVPPDQIDQCLADLPQDKTLVAYCRGPYCAYSYQLVEALQGSGCAAYRLEEGLPDLKTLGLPIEQTVSS